MANSGKCTVLFEKEGVLYKLCKIIFGSDGSYYVTVPYHSAKKGIFVKLVVNYSQRESKVNFGDTIDMASADEQRIKLSHHPDGFVQFSGEGLVSGKDANGSIKGIGVMSWPLKKPVRGPAFGIVVKGIEDFEQAEDRYEIKAESCIFHRDELYKPTPAGSNGILLEGHYFPPQGRRFLQTLADGTHTISIVHPIGAIMPLKVVLASDTCSLPGFMGLSLWEDCVDFPDAQSGFSISGSTGNIRFNENGDKLADGIGCFYPWIGEEGITRNLGYLNAGTRVIPSMGTFLSYLSLLLMAIREILGQSMNA